MKFIRALTAALLLGAFGIVGCGEGDDTSEVTPVQGEDPAKIMEQYESTGRYGPGGQNTPPEQPAEGTNNAQ